MKKRFLNFFFALLTLPFINSCKKDFTHINAASTDALNVVTTKPNIVFILADDVGYEVPTVNGGQSYSTPNMDLMAHYGMRFTQCYAAPMCSPSRFMLTTGKYNFRNYTIWGQMDLGQRTFVNMLSDAGYDTYAAGKWQLDNGDLGVRTFGFNGSYVIFEQYEDMDRNHDADPLTLGRYKSPELYANGASLPSGTTENKYCDDILVDSVVAYANRSAKKGSPFFIYYSTSLAHQPYSPTPDDPEYATWDPLKRKSDSTFYPSMVKYLDKKLGQLFRRFDSMGLAKNTVFIFVGDNGCPHAITSLYKGQEIVGGKMKTNVWGTHVPLMIYWRGVVRPNSVNRDLIDFTDFLPTLAGIANIPVPTTYGTLDGVSFYPRLRGQAGTPRDWVFCQYAPNQNGISPIKRWTQDTTYKLYDSTGYFYNIYLDPSEKNRLKNLTEEQKERKAYFQSVMDTLH